MSKSLSGFQLLQLKSERIRAIGMILVLAVVASIGIYHLVSISGNPEVGITIIIICLIFAGFETVFLLYVQWTIKSCRQVTEWLRYFESFVESVFPVVAMVVLMDVSDKPFTVLLSPAYALIIIIIAGSSLRLNPRLTLFTGVLSTMCYTILTLSVLQVDSTLHLNPHPTYIYLNMALMLLVATMVMYFITRQIRSYVNAAAQEMVLQRELELASQVQTNLLPSPLPILEGYEVAAFNKPATHTGGDYYDCIQTDSLQTIFMIADVTGHGVGPALITASSRAYFRAILEENQQLKEIFQQANYLLQKDMCSGQFVTLAAVMLDINSHIIKYISAGHGPTLVIRNKDGTVENLPAQSIPLGVDTPLTLEDVIEVKLLPGDIVAMFSDGCYEEKNDKGEAFGLERLTDLLKSNQGKSVNDIAMIFQSAVKGFSDKLPQSDDMTMLLLKRLE